MWLNNLKIAWRALLRQRHFSLINILGLSVSIAACLLLFQMVRYELSFDRHHQKADRIFRIVTTEKNEHDAQFTSGIPIPAMDAMAANIPQFEVFTRLHSFYPQIASPDAPGLKFSTDGLKEVAAFAEPNFFQIFDWDWLAGDPGSSLSEPNTVVLTESLAEKCFGSWQVAMGKTLLLDQDLELAIRGIIVDPPANSDFQFNLLASYETLRKHPDIFGYTPNWNNISSNDQAWALLHHPDQEKEAARLLAEVGKEEYADDVFKKKHLLQALSEQHFNDQIGHLGTHSVTPERLWTLSLIGLLVLIMACFNFINLATAQAGARSREVGVRKTLGSTRNQLMQQFLGEAAVTVFLSVVAGALLATTFSPFLPMISEVPRSLPFFSDWQTLAFLGLLFLGISLLAGFYPAFVLAGFDPVQALKNNLQTRVFAGLSLRKVLVFLQFGIAQVLIIGTLVTISQMEYIRNLDLGYQPDLVYTINGLNADSSSTPLLAAFKNQLLQMPEIQSVSYSSDPPTSGNNWDSNFSFGHQANDAPFNTSLKIADAEYLNTYGFRLLAGVPYRESDTTRTVVVNMLLLERLGITDPKEAIGKELRLGGGVWRPIVGVVQDFTANSAREPVKPMTILPAKQFYSTVGIKIKPGNVDQTIAHIGQTFAATFPDQVLDGQFLDDRIAQFYRAENRFAALAKAFAVLAIFISCLGLFGLASLLVAQKTKEIGIRKVLGASVTGVVGLLSVDFVKLVLIAFLVAAPVAWYMMQVWLQDFVFRTPIHWWIFLLTAVLVLGVAFFTVSLQVVKAASANPVNSLRNE
ncbi:MAG: FtsX-like permease family protein [Bacteroidetes bacterium]|nr:MAG: FtsX-like permease family protein [Bacteroidota bacterium]